MNDQQDSELQTMEMIQNTLQALPDDDARARVLWWAASKFGTKLEFGPAKSTAGTHGSQDFTDFPSVFDAARPHTGEDRALLAAYWFQKAQGRTDLDSQSINNVLKDMGHGDSNITASLTRLKERKPALILQVKKSGRSRQARKTYRLTAAGTRRVEEMLADEESADNNGGMS